jgi:hypothetical protein
MVSVLLFAEHTVVEELRFLKFAIGKIHASVQTLYSSLPKM